MGLFNNNKITVKRELQDNTTILYVDYHKQKDTKGFKNNLIQDLIGENQALVVIDTSLSYMKNDVNIDKEVEVLVNLLDEQMISYRKIVKKSDSNLTILGVPFKLNSSKKTNNYTIGFVVTSSDMEKIQSIADYYNMHFYMIEEYADPVELLDEFYTIRGEMEELNDLFEFNVYNDIFFGKMRISQKNENMNTVDQVLQKHIK